MLLKSSFPYIKAYMATKNRVLFVTFTDECRHGYEIAESVGSGLIDFAELDLEDYTKKTKRLTEHLAAPYSPDRYNRLRNIIFDIAQLLQGKHRYVYFYLVGELNNLVLAPLRVDEDSLRFIGEAQMDILRKCADALLEVKHLHNFILEAIWFCLDVEAMPDLPQAERFGRFCSKYPDLVNFGVGTGTIIAPAIQGKFDIEAAQRIVDSGVDDPSAQSQMIHPEKQGVSLVEYFVLENLEEMLLFEFLQMLKAGISIRRCRVCERYFILRTRHVRYYCDGVGPDGQPCKQIGRALTHSSKLEEDMFLQQYQTERDKVYSRYYRADGKFDVELSGKDLTKEQFDVWSSAAKESRKKYLAGEITGEELMAKVRVP